MPTGYLAFVLHAHLPFVRHPEHARHLEERWLYEALVECYLPLLDAFDRMADEGVPFGLTMSVTPPLAAMLKDELLRQRFHEHLARVEALSEREMKRLCGDAQLRAGRHLLPGPLRAHARACGTGTGGTSSPGSCATGMRGGWSC